MLIWWQYNLKSVKTTLLTPVKGVLAHRSFGKRRISTTFCKLRYKTMDENCKRKLRKAMLLCKKKFCFSNFFYTDVSRSFLLFFFKKVYYPVLPHSTGKQCVKLKLRCVCTEKRSVCPKPSRYTEVLSLQSFVLFCLWSSAGHGMGWEGCPLSTLTPPWPPSQSSVGPSESGCSPSGSQRAVR